MALSRRGAAAFASNGGIISDLHNEPTFVRFDETSPSIRSARGSQTWRARTKNAILDYSFLRADDNLESMPNESETIVLAPDDTTDVRVRWNHSEVVLKSRGLVVVPAGASQVYANTDCAVVRLLDASTHRDANDAVNENDYSVDRPDVREAHPGQGAVTEKLRRYLLSDVPVDPARFGNVFRSRLFMVNLLNVDPVPRDPEQLSPHVHDDFEQMSFVVVGSYVHHVRMPWTERRSQWRDDVHYEIGAPSVTVIRPGTIHTSQSVGAGPNAMIDIFSPPRQDFSARSGMVLNAEDYP